MASKKAPISDEEKLELALVAARRSLAETRVASGTKLGPAQLRERVVEQLMREGFERAGKQVRAPLTAQMAELLESGAHLPLSTLPKRLKGSSTVEIKKLASALVREGKAHLVLRGRQVALVPPAEHALTISQLAEALREAKSLLDWLKKAKADKLPVSVLVSDLKEALATFPQGKTSPQQSDPSFLTLRGALLALRDEESGLISIPALSTRLRPQMTAERVKTELLNAFRQGLLELRPEGGIGRLSPDDAALCPLGAGGIPLSWAQLLENIVGGELER
jgi:hypothetical protein